MTREEYIDFANALKNNYTIDFDKLPEFCDMAISLLSESKGDLISRQAVLNALKEHRSLFCDNTPETFSKLSYAEKSRVDELDTAIATIINLPSVENKGEWIPVSERLPEEKQAVLVWCPEYKNIYCAYCVNGSWWIFGAFSQIIPNAVIAWQPLPEPYKKGGEE